MPNFQPRMDANKREYSQTSWGQTSWGRESFHSVIPEIPATVKQFLFNTIYHHAEKTPDPLVEFPWLSSPSSGGATARSLGCQPKVPIQKETPSPGGATANCFANRLAVSTHSSPHVSIKDSNNQSLSLTLWSRYSIYSTSDSF